jgi:predicted RNA-binding protein with PIN domain
VRTYGLVTARFIRTGQTADAAIRAHLTRLGAAARNWTVVSSDQEVQRASRAARAQTISSEAFSRQITETLQAGPAQNSQNSNPPLSPDELQDWLDLFDAHDPDDKG